jgi:hypothetical protein
VGYPTYYAPVIGDAGEHEVPDERREEILAWLERDEAFRIELEDVQGAA